MAAPPPLNVFVRNNNLFNNVPLLNPVNVGVNTDVDSSKELTY